ncbi:MAG: fused MFS/spermidine synthase [Flavobacteriales bacterium]|nr:fused MFS/spermidine synthase [Bacteroidota bacterium]MCB9241640.1 fused MFS/spermidine synthase [Flavobacteriales bacterium]
MSIQTHQKTRFKQAGFLLRLKWVVSYLWPIGFPHHKLNQKGLYLQWYRGELQLFTTKATYSFGSLQWAFKRLFAMTSLPYHSVKDVLILGYGLGGVADLIQQKTSTCSIIGVELDPDIAEVAEAWFDRPNVNLIVQDAADFVKECENRFDLIVIDVYHDLDVPQSIQHVSFLSACANLLNPGGVVVMNKVVNFPLHEEERLQLLLDLGKCFRQVEDVQSTNLNHMLVAKAAKVAQ